MRLKGELFEQFCDALRSAFNYERLRSMVRISLEENLNNIVTRGPFEDQAEELVLWAERNGRIQDLIDGARKSNPTNITLEAIEERLNEMGDDAYVTSSDGDRSASAKASDVTDGSKERDDQYEIVLNWDAKGSPKLRGFDLSGRDLSSLSLTSTNLSYANLKDANLVGTNLSATSLIGADLSGANLLRANLYGTVLNEADLSGAKLTATNLHSAQLYRATLRGANLREADLRETKLRKADLRKANLAASKVNWANLTNANLAEATNLEKADLRGARYNMETIWPDGFDPKKAGAILVDDEGYPVEE